MRRSIVALLEVSPADCIVLHELVHTIQYDGQHLSHSTAPSWLTESIADYVRLQAHLGPPHWRKAGQGRELRGWEDGYDAGARFFAWLEDWRDPGQANATKGVSTREARERERMMAEVTIRARMGVPVVSGRKAAAGRVVRVGRARTSAQGSIGGTTEGGAGSWKDDGADVEAPRMPARPKAAPIVPSTHALDRSPGSSSSDSGSGSGSGTRTPTQASTARSRQLNGNAHRDERKDRQPLYVVLNDEDDPSSPLSTTAVPGDDISRTATPTQASIRSSALEHTRIDAHKSHSTNDSVPQKSDDTDAPILHQPAPSSTRYPLLTQPQKKQQPLQAIPPHSDMYDDEEDEVEPAIDKADGPWPGLIANINKRLRDGKYDEAWWAELTGVKGGLEGLWERYLADYRT